MRRATWLPDVLREAGLSVVEHDGWKERGKDFSDLEAVVWHHDASPPGDSPGVPAYMLREMKAGRAGAQLWVDRRGTWHVLAAGVAFHAGRVRAGMPDNGRSLGVETDHTTNEAWPPALLSSLRVGTAAILRKLGQDSTGLHFHKTICSPPGRKSDPDGLELAPERGKVAVLMSNKTTKPTPAPALEESDEMTNDDWSKLTTLLDDRVRILLRAQNAKGEATGHPNLQNLTDRLDRIEKALGSGS